MRGVQRMSRWLAAICALLHVAVETHIILLGSDGCRVRCGVHTVAATAAHFIAFMHAASPGQMHITLMTACANSILIGDGCHCLSPKYDNWRMPGCGATFA